MKRVLLISSLIALTALAHAQDRAPAISIFFGNDKQSIPRREFPKLDASHFAGASEVVVEGFSSIAGRNAYNVALSQSRADTISNYIRKITDCSVISLGRGEDWDTFVSILDTLDAPYADSLLTIAQRHIRVDRDNIKGTGKPSIFADNYVYADLHRRVLPQLCRTDIYITYDAQLFTDDKSSDNVEEEPCIDDFQAVSVDAASAVDDVRIQDSTVVDYSHSLFSETLPDLSGLRDTLAQEDNVVTAINPQPITNPEFQSRIVISPRTNLLVPLFNIGLELPLGRHLSFAMDAYYPWLGYDRGNRYCLQAMAADAEVRVYLAPKELSYLRGNTFTGFSLAFGALAGQYDLEYDYDGQQGEFYGGYLDLAYTFYIRRHCRLTLSVSGGYTHIVRADYTVYEKGGKLIRDDSYFNNKLEWIGPSKAAVSLSFPIISKGGSNEK